MKRVLSAERLRELLHYDSETGFFRWIVKRSGIRRDRNGAAGGPDGNGYLRIRVDGVFFPAHRLAWLYMTGEMPRGIIDHIDGDIHNNRFNNLRDVTYEFNNQNKRRATIRSKTGLLGVCAPTASSRKYSAQIGVNGKRVSLGKFETAEDAHLAYVAAKRRLHEACTI